jgi:hypothetical protein
MSENIKKKTPFAKKLINAFATGTVLGVILFFIGSGVSGIIPNGEMFPLIGFVTGFAGSVAVAVSEDIKD